MKLIQISPFPAYPPSSGGQQRIHGLMKEHGEWTVDRVATSALSSAELYESNKITSLNIEPGYTEQVYHSLLLAGINKPLRETVGFPGVHSAYLLRPLIARLSRRHPVHELLGDYPDLVCVEFPWMVPYVSNRVECPVVFSSHNVEIEFFDEIAPNAPDWLRKRIVAREAAALEHADLTLATSQPDIAEYKKRYGFNGPHHIAPNAATVPKKHEIKITPNFTGQQQTAVRAAFVGAGGGPNTEAAQRVLSIADQLRRTDIEVKFDIIGTVCEELPDETPENVFLRGYVNDLTSALAPVDIGLNPVTRGSGTNVKMADYFAHGLAVITTPFGKKGITNTPTKRFIIRDLESFPEAIREFIQRDIDPEAIARAGRSFAEDTLNWSVVSAELFQQIFPRLTSPK